MSDPPDRPLERAVLTLLRPLARLLLKRGLAYGEFAELAKRAFVESARRDFGVAGRKTSVSRVAVLTGLTRKEARRLLDAEPTPEEEPPRRRINRAARVLSAWVRERAYRDGRGAPASLPFDGPAEPTFSGLVAQHGGDVTPRAVLDELIRVGAVVRLKNGRLRPVERSYVPQTDEAAKLAILGTDVADLVATIDHNLDARPGETFFQRKVAYDDLPAAYLPELNRRVRREAQTLLERFDAEMARHDRDVAGGSEREARDPSDRRRAMVGIYYFEDEVDDDA
ncbi:MAG: hypothetical protein H6748_19860 [Spirochaetaceae bacterium]|nr:hypothetical protein [Myxococcales bacterium]MCB9726313.1 hypothetical protein [Spirochaetaceae bacterium]